MTVSVRVCLCMFHLCGCCVAVSMQFKGTTLTTESTALRHTGSGNNASDLKSFVAEAVGVAKPRAKGRKGTDSSRRAPKRQGDAGKRSTDKSEGKDNSEGKPKTRTKRGAPTSRKTEL